MIRWVLGLSLHNDAAACLVRDGEPVVAIAEERLTRVKRAACARDDAVAYCLEAAGIGPDELALVVLTSTSAPGWLGRDPARIWRWYDGVVRRETRAPFSLAARGLPVEILTHHMAHAFAAFGASGFKDAAALIVDAAGSARIDLTHPAERRFRAGGSPFERERVSMYHFTDGFRVRTIEKQLSCVIEDDNAYGLPVALPDGIGGLYEAVARFLFREAFAEGKVMGLAAHGRPSADLLADDERGRFRLRWDWVRDLIGQPAHARDPMEYAALAASAQATLEAMTLSLARRLHRETGARRLAYGGCVALNAAANARLEREGPFEDVFILPASGDAGTALGAAIYGDRRLGGTRTYAHARDDLGRAYRQSEIEDALRAAAPLVAWQRMDDDALARHVAERLAAGQVVGWFEGGSELGPRALGHRSILADPRVPGMKDHLNHRVKRREAFCPFAPVVPAERAAELFALPRARPFMLCLDPVRPEQRARIPAAVHVDGTARVQTVTRASHPRLHALLCAFDEVAGVPVLINTSLRAAGEPLVERPAEAIAMLARGALDALVLEAFVVEVPPQRR